MSEKRKTDFSLNRLDDLFTSQSERENGLTPTIKDIPLEKLVPFPNHPFKVRDDEEMNKLVESVSENGVLVPAIVREKDNGDYEIISGHRRKFASEIAGKSTLRCIVSNLDDDAATVIMVDSNIQRENILPSEKAFAYKMKLDAMVSFLFCKVVKNMIKEEQLDNMLYEKMQKEYDLFLEKIKSEQSVKPNNAIESAYEIVYKQDILYCFEDDDLNLSYKEKKHLLSKKRPLEFLYQEWLATDCTHMQMIRDCIKDSTGYDLKLTQKQKQKNREER